MAEIVKPPARVIAGLTLIIAALIVAATLAQRMARGRSAGGNIRAKGGYEKPEDYPPPKKKQASAAPVDAPNATPNVASSSPRAASPEIPASPRARKLYLQMSDAEKSEFIYVQARNISRMMSNREYVFTDEVLPYIKHYVDGYARRVGNNSTAIWGEDLNLLFGRARRLAPDIIREFNTRGSPKVVGLYIPMIESEYRECLTSPVGAKGLFQFMPATARGYGVDPSDRCDVKKMAPAAAKYIKDRIAEFGSDSMSVALGIAGYNRSPDSVRRDLSDVLNSKNKERSFWTLVANSDKLDRFFQNENIKYVPKFFAAAIVGENPWAFGLEMDPLSTYTESSGGK